MRLKAGAPDRSAMDAEPGDFVKIGEDWQRITANTASGKRDVPSSWTVTTEDGKVHSPFAISRYAKAEDLEEDKAEAPKA